ncbi:MAG: hypothetical protein ACTHJR_04215 [Sphingomonas sp.]|uniref:hypothetical protein n=1 Tax=Sphingomonas sp. TaxID=28214 RepID=UPI003F7F0C9F
MPQILSVLAKTPEWIRHDLVSRDVSSRERAEEALAAMITAALAGQATTAPAPQGIGIAH